MESRVGIVELLRCEGPLYTRDIVKSLGMPWSTVIETLRRLAKRGVVVVERDGTRYIWRFR